MQKGKKNSTTSKPEKPTPESNKIIPGISKSSNASGIKRSLALCLVLLVASGAPLLANTLTVKSTADAGGTCPGADCTLRQAIASAASGDTIIFSLPANSAITLTSAELTISKNLTINGPGANLLTVQRSAAGGTPNFRIFNIAGSSTVTISGLTIANGNAFGNSGGGIYNISTGTLTVTGCAISGNFANGGGGIFNNGGTLTITNSTISGNSASNGSGGGILNLQGALTITNSTISGNSAGSDFGGGIFNNFTGKVTLTSSTIFGNSAASGGGGVCFAFQPGFFGSVMAKNTIIALNTSSVDPDVSGPLTSLGFNLVGNEGDTMITPTTGDQIGTKNSPINPLLGPLQDNGGPTFTHALLSGSPAIEKGNSSGSNTDQRGFARPVDTPFIANASSGDGADIGAYEVQADQLPGCNNINTVVNNNNNSGAGSLRDVIANVCAGVTITFAPNVRGAINLTSAELAISKSLTINGPGANLLTVQRSAAGGTPAFRIFNIAGNIKVAISGLTISNGSAPGNYGGGIYNNGAAETIISNSTISGNAAGSAGGLYNTGDGFLTIADSTISGNSGNGGGILNDNGTVNITNSTISGNSAQFFGGGIYNFSTITITNSTIAGNTAGSSGGGGISNGSGTVTIKNTIIALNTSASGPDVKGALFSEGFNLIGNSKDGTIAPAQLSDQIGTAGSPINPLLGPLQDNGGPTFTQALLTGSPAIDKGNASGSTTDQRGFTRPVGNPPSPNPNGGDGSDIGAFEFGSSLPTPTPSPTPTATPT
ncbi:MAG: choice-of-anchor Q domain-containing protein, partial [Gemmatimonadaceae bacterium]